MINLEEFKSIKKGDWLEVKTIKYNFYTEAIKDASLNWGIETSWGYIGWDSIEKIEGIKHPTSKTLEPSKNSYNIVIQGYCETVLAVYKIEAESYEEAEQKAKEKYFEDLDIYSVSDKEAEELKEKYGLEEDEENIK